MAAAGILYFEVVNLTIHYITLHYITFFNVA